MMGCVGFRVYAERIAIQISALVVYWLMMIVVAVLSLVMGMGLIIQIWDWYSERSMGNRREESDKWEREVEKNCHKEALTNNKQIANKMKL
jgi:predicted negative regulator of RcsB-dependent stress response